MSALIKTASKPRLSFKIQTLYCVGAIVAAVVIPQIFHMFGRISGLGTALGETFLPMHLPIILVGLLAGPYAGAVAGMLSPLCSYLLSGMPGAVMLPFMMIELCAYGLFSGLLRNVKMPTVLKILAVQISGRLVRAAAILFAIYALNNQVLNAAIIYNSILTGAFGICLQLVLLPLIVYRVENISGKSNEQ